MICRIKSLNKKRIGLLIHLILLLFLASVYLNQLISPKKTPYFELIALIYPIFLIVYFISIFFWIFLDRKIFLFLFLFLLLLIYPIKKYLHFNLYPTSVKNTENRIKVLTYNINYANEGEGLYKLERYIKNNQVDIAFFQEIYRKQWRTEEPFLADRYNAVYDLVGISSIYPIVHKQKIILPNNGYACLADIQKNDKIIRCICIYLEPMFLNRKNLKIENISELNDKIIFIIKSLFNGYRKHQTQIDLLKKYIEESPYPLIVCGDFNSVPLSYEYFTLKRNLQDTFNQSGSGLGFSFYDYFYPLRIDYTFITKDFVSLFTKIDRIPKFSDHYPLISIIKYR